MRGTRQAGYLATQRVLRLEEHASRLSGGHAQGQPLFAAWHVKANGTRRSESGSAPLFGGDTRAPLEESAGYETGRLRVNPKIHRDAFMLRFDSTMMTRDVLRMPGRGLEPLRIAPPDPKSGASANFATLATASVCMIIAYYVVPHRCYPSINLFSISRAFKKRRKFFKTKDEANAELHARKVYWNVRTR